MVMLHIQRFWQLLGGLQMFSGLQTLGDLQMFSGCSFIPMQFYRLRIETADREMIRFISNAIAFVYVWTRCSWLRRSRVTWWNNDRAGSLVVCKCWVVCKCLVVCMYWVFFKCWVVCKYRVVYKYWVVFMQAISLSYSHCFQRIFHFL